jgi:ribosomal protein L29
MTTKTEEADLRPLSAEEIEEAAGALTVKLFGYRLDVNVDDSNTLHVWIGKENADGSARYIRLI